MLGRTISHYHITKKLGGGGMGVVYQATDQRLDRTVALKFLPPHLSSDPEANDRFILEAKAASSLDHANICTIHDISQADDGQFFIVMAHYEGQTLKHKLAEGALSVKESLDFAIQVAKGLERAHEAGIVHRDIKPANLMVTDRGEVKILDFGLAKLMGGVELTQLGTRLGTVAYMSPEQARSEEVDHRTDVWSLGAVLYEMLAGRRPFEGDYEHALVYSVLNVEPEPLADLNPEMPEALASIVERAIAKQADLRYQSVAEMKQELEALRATQASISAAGTRDQDEHKWISGYRLVALIAVVILVAGAFVIWATWNIAVPTGGETGPAAERTAIAVLPFDVQGGEDLAYLREGMVTSLSKKLDGAGTLRSVDYNAVLGFIDRNPDQVLDPVGGREVAAHFEVGSYILGTVFRAGTETQLLATLYDAEGDKITEAQSAFSNDSLFMQAVDVLAQELVAGLLGDADQQMASLAVGTTASFPAFKAYLEGDQALREGRFEEAIEATRRAVEIDSTFALAWHQLSVSESWDGGGNTPEVSFAREQALQYSRGLTGRAKVYVEGIEAFYAGKADQAEQILQNLLAIYPDDIVALGWLGETYFHANPRRGRPASEAQEYFEKVLYYDADNGQFRSHLIELAGKDRDYAALDSFVNQIATQSPYLSGLRDAYGFIQSHPEKRDSLFVAYQSATPAKAAYAWIGLLVFEKIDDAQRLAATYADTGPTPQDRLGSTRAYRVAALTRGQWDANFETSPSSSSYLEGYDVVHNVLNQMLPFASAPGTTLDTLEHRLSRWDPEKNPYQYIFGDTLASYIGQEAYIKEYLLGLLSWCRGDLVGTRRNADGLMQREDTDAPNSLAYKFARTLEALVYWEEEKGDQALGALDEVHLNAQALGNSFLVFSRYVRAEILNEQGRYEEALSWYRSLHDGNSISGVRYLGPSYLRRAEIYEQMGDIENAITYYTRFLELWKDADPELQAAWVDPARQRLDRLVGDTAREPSDVASPGE